MNYLNKIIIGLGLCIIASIIIYQLTSFSIREGITMPTDVKTAKTVSNLATSNAATIQTFYEGIVQASLNATTLLNNATNASTSSDTTSTSATAASSAINIATSDALTLQTSLKSVVSSISTISAIDISAITTDTESFNELSTAITEINDAIIHNPNPIIILFK